MRQFILVFSLLILVSCSDEDTRNDNLDTTFNPGTGVDDFYAATANCIAIQPDGKIVVGGNFVTFNQTAHSNMVRLNSNGSVDESFTFGWINNGTPVALALQQDEKIVVGIGGGTNSNYINRLNTDGTVDPSFYSGTGFNWSVNTLAIQPDGKIIAGGDFFSFNGNPQGNIARLNSDGTLDESFTTGSGFNERIFAISLQSDGKIIVGGRFTEFNGIGCNQIARLNSDGSMDESFDTGNESIGEVLALALESDGDIIVCGANKIARLKSNGILDNSFDAVMPSQSHLITIAIQNDGKIIVGGMFDPSVQAKDIARLNNDGTIDKTYNIGKGFNGTVYNMKLQDDGKLIAVGGFTKFNGTSRNGIARLNQ